MKVGKLCALVVLPLLLGACSNQAPLSAQESGISPTQQQGGTSLSQSNSPTDQTSLTPSQSRQQQVKLILMGELDNLIPGKMAKGSVLEKAIEGAVQALIAGNNAETTRILTEQRKTNPAFPPVELLQAGLSYGIGDSAGGLKTLEEAAQKHPDYPGIFFAFARLAISQRRMTDAQALLEKAERKLKGQKKLTADEIQHFNALLYELTIDTASYNKDYDLVRQNVKKLLSIRPNNLKAKLTEAELEFVDENYQSSFSRLQELHKANPGTQLPELVMASWFQQQANKTETQKWIRRAAEAYPDNASVQMAFANYALRNGDFPEANSAVKKVEDISGEIPATLALKAKMAFANQAYGMAEIHYEKLAKIQPTSFDASNMYALALIESASEEKRKLALSLAQRNYQQLPDNPVAQAAFGWVLLKAGEAEKARILLTRAARSPDLAPEIAYFLATLMHQSGKSQQAKLVLEPVMETNNLFLYRNAASKLMTKINEATKASLPDPK